MLIQITEEDIKTGEKSDPAHCPIAKAVKRVLVERGVELESDGVIVGIDSVYVFRKDMDDSAILLPPKAKKFIKGFDAGKESKPIEFEMKEIK